MKKKKKANLYDRNFKDLKILIIIFIAAIIYNIISLFPFSAQKNVLYIIADVFEIFVAFSMYKALKKHKLLGASLEILFGAVLYICALTLVLIHPLFFAVTFFEGLIGILIIDQGLDFYRLISEKKDVKVEEYVYAENINDEHIEIKTNDGIENTNDF